MNVSYRPPIKTTYGGTSIERKTGHLPNSMRLAMNQSTWTFQLYCGLFGEVKLDIQSVLWTW